MKAGIRVGVDVGGSFTDFAIVAILASSELKPAVAAKN
jgi:N-methylhydantoinase A/oxoprolinase/acetone carboxylase beta subunit